jgi:SAM-dependent methyltransferase
VLKFSDLLNKLSYRKSIDYIRNYGFLAFLKKAKGKLSGMSLVSPSSSKNIRAHPAVNFIRQKIAPLSMEIIPDERCRINILISIINFRYFFGGYIGVFNLAKMLNAEGLNVRLIIVDECRYEPEVWRKEIRKYEGLENFFDFVEVEYAFLRSTVIRVSRKDIFVATSWWTAHVANYARKYLNSNRFLYLIQEYEPVFYPMGTFAALALESYTFPHYALFSTTLLREYFSQNRLGVFRDGKEAGEHASVAIENAILKFDVDEVRMGTKVKRKLLFYSRPEEHAARNLFELGVIALSNLIMGGHIDSEKWEFYGIGSVEWGNHKIALHEKTFLQLLPKMSLEEYKNLLPEFDVGLSLMLTPHPSLPPIEMAAAGMLVVTNTYANKTAECLREISTNIMPAEPTVEGIETALISAINECGNYSSRVAGAKVNWSQSWEDTYDRQCMGKIRGLLNACSHSPRSAIQDVREKLMAQAYIDSVSKDPGNFVHLISPEDEMYAFTRDKAYQKETAAYIYYKLGKESLLSIENILLACGKSFAGISSFLDFACGYGRVTRFLIQEIDPGRIWVSDIYSGAVDFQKKSFKVNGFCSETEPSKVEFPRKFEVVYAGSLFSHLPPDSFEEWLAILHGVLEDNGILIFSTHGKSLCPARFSDSAGFTFLNCSESRTLPTEEYGSMFVSRDWVERLAGKLNVNSLYFLEKGLCGYQDLYVTAKKDIPALNNLAPSNYPHGNIDSAQINGDGNLHISGWAIDNRFGVPVKDVSIYIGDELVGKAVTGLSRPTVADYFKRPGYLHSGWEYNGATGLTANMNADMVLIKVVVSNDDDCKTYLISSL